jgi:feruloyl-CoA synthase
MTIVNLEEPMGRLRAEAVLRAPVRKVALGPCETNLERQEDGCIVLRSPHVLGDYPANLTDRLVHWACVRPTQPFLARRENGGPWHMVTYAHALEQALRLSQALLDRGLSIERPIAILSDNDFDHALLALAALHVGVPYAPVSPAYSLVSQDFNKLRYVLGLLRPGLVFVADGERYARALKAVMPADAELVVAANAASGVRATDYATLLATSPTPAVAAAHASAGPDAIAKILFTSGSTGQPKGVINTQRMLCSNQEMLATALPFIREQPPVIVDWLPWNHTFGGNHNFGLVLYNGGTLYIDDGRPLPGRFDETVRNLREIAPTMYFNVPRGFEELAAWLRREATLRERFFSRVQMLFYAGAGLSQPVWDAFEELAVQTCGERILWITGLGSTETAPFATCANWEAGRSGMIGLPAVGQELKLAPAGDKLEARFKGPNVTPGYWRQPEFSVAAFDAEGYYRMGDAVRFADPDQPQRGLVFDGRLSEDFKLSSGSWVSVGPLRAHLIAACSPLVQDVVITGHDREFLGALVFPRLDQCRALCPDLAAHAGPDEVLPHASVMAKFRELLKVLAADATGSSRRIERAILLGAPASMDAGEITDKGSINQGSVLAHRAQLVEELYRSTPSSRTICVVRTEQ